MKNVTDMIPVLWEIIQKNKKCHINVIKGDNDIVVSILIGRRWKRFSESKPDILISNLRTQYDLG